MNDRMGVAVTNVGTATKNNLDDLATYMTNTVGVSISWMTFFLALITEVCAVALSLELSFYAENVTFVALLRHWVHI